VPASAVATLKAAPGERASRKAERTSIAYSTAKLAVKSFPEALIEDLRTNAPSVGTVQRDGTKG
jgi:hypothetical protein